MKEIIKLKDQDTSSVVIFRYFNYDQKCFYCSKKDAVGIAILNEHQGEIIRVSKELVENWEELPDTVCELMNWPEFGHISGDFGFENVWMDFKEFEEEYLIYLPLGETVKKQK